MILMLQTLLTRNYNFVLCNSKYGIFHFLDLVFDIIKLLENVYFKNNQ